LISKHRTSTAFNGQHYFKRTAGSKVLGEYYSSYLWLDWATIQFRVFGPSSFNTALQLVLRPHFLVHFV
jgi:hypothetical protein